MTIFLAIDGDKVGAKLEVLLITEKLDQATLFSLKVTSAIGKMVELIEQQQGIIIFAGGDNIMAKFDELGDLDTIVNELGYSLNQIFFEVTGCTTSIGIGHRPRDAFLALKLAKGSDKSKLVDLRN